MPVCAAYPDRLAVRAQRGSRSVSFAMAAGVNVSLLSEKDPLGQVSGDSVFFVQSLVTETFAAILQRGPTKLECSFFAF